MVNPDQLKERAIMSRKHFEAIAAILAAEYAIAPESAKLTLRNLIMSLADNFKQENPRFNRERFYVAAGIR